jgi:hypothetical protein
MMTTKTLGSCAAVAVCLVTAPLLAHHSLANYDTTTAVRVKGTVVEIHLINPHSIIFLEEQTSDGQSRRWALEGPSVLQLKRTGFASDTLKAGDIVEVCGYLPKEAIVWQLGSTDPLVRSTSGRLLNAEVLTMPDGRERNWGDYGVHRCFAPGYRDAHSK